jgi:ABC-type uncharacterized transport system ATPase subunit
MLTFYNIPDNLLKKDIAKNFLLPTGKVTGFIGLNGSAK